MEESTPAKLSVEKVRDVYSRLAPLYGFWEKWAEGRARKLALELAAVRDGETVLEVAVGPGTAMEQLTRANPAGTTAGVDLTLDMLQRTRRLFRRRSLPAPALCQCDARSLPFPEDRFDLVFSGYMLDLLSVSDIPRALGDMRRVLKPSGRLVLLYLSLGNPWFDRLWRFFYWLVPELLGGCRPIRLTAQLPEAGFAILQARRITQWGVPAEVILARRQG